MSNLIVLYLLIYLFIDITGIAKKPLFPKCKYSLNMIMQALLVAFLKPQAKNSL